MCNSDICINNKNILNVNIQTQYLQLFIMVEYDVIDIKIQIKRLNLL